MNVVASTADFRRAVNIATRATERRNNLPILGAVRCRANGSLEVTGTDLDILISASVPRVPGPDAMFALTNPQAIAHAVHTAGGDDTTIAQRDGDASISSGALTVTAATMPADDFPMHLDRPVAPLFEVDLSREHIAQMQRVAGAVSTEETRYYLNGLHLARVNDNTIRATATNGHILFFVDMVVPGAAGAIPDGGVIIPTKAVNLLFGFGKAAKSGVRLVVGTPAAANEETSTAPDRKGLPVIVTSMREGTADVKMTAKLIDGTFPDCQRVVPAVTGRQAILPVEQLRRALRAISGVSRYERVIRLSFDQPDTVTVSAAYVSLSLSASISIPCKHSMDKLVVGFNGGYLTTVLASAGGDELVLDEADCAAPALFRNPADASWTGLLMPVRI